jgi:hypothetical protein
VPAISNRRRRRGALHCTHVTNWNQCLSMQTGRFSSRRWKVERDVPIGLGWCSIQPVSPNISHPNQPRHVTQRGAAATELKKRPPEWVTEFTERRHRASQRPDKEPKSGFKRYRPMNELIYNQFNTLNLGLCGSLCRSSVCSVTPFEVCKFLAAQQNLPTM